MTVKCSYRNGSQGFLQKWQSSVPTEMAVKCSYRNDSQGLLQKWLSSVPIEMAVKCSYRNDFQITSIQVVPYQSLPRSAGGRLD